MITVFTGPTISAEEVQSVLSCRCLPPAAQGDIYKAALDKPRVIGIVDGYFQGRLSIWHKEILWAMSQGIHVFGCSSMGALRAAELHTYGMRGVGKIFESYRDGVIEDDDEVALLHGPEETGFAQVSEPMVNVRATLTAAADSGVIDAAFSALLLWLAKATFYQNLSWKGLLSSAEIRRYDSEQVQRLKDWLPEGRVDAKRRDALQMLRSIGDFIAQNPAPQTVDYHFEWTHLWDEVVAKGVQNEAEIKLACGTDARDLLDEIRLDPDRYQRVRHDALLQALVAENAAGSAVDRKAVRDAVARFRLSHGLLSVKALDAWLDERGMSQRDLEQSLENDLRRDLLLSEANGALSGQMLTLLKTAPEFPELMAKVRRKKALQKRQNGEGVAAGIPRLKLLEWFFGAKLRRPIPDDLDGFVADLDLPGTSRFYEILARDYDALAANDAASIASSQGQVKSGT